MSSFAEFVKWCRRDPSKSYTVPWTSQPVTNVTCYSLPGGQVNTNPANIHQTGDARRQCWNPAMILLMG